MICFCVGICVDITLELTMDPDKVEWTTLKKKSIGQPDVSMKKAIDAQIVLVIRAMFGPKHSQNE